MMMKKITRRIAQLDFATVLKFPAARLVGMLQSASSCWLGLLPQGLRCSLVMGLQPARSSLMPRLMKESALQTLFSQQKLSGLGQWAQWLGLLGVSVSALAENPHRPFTRLPYLQGSLSLIHI